MGFNIEKLVREALESMTIKVCWATKFCVKYYDFLTQPEKHANEFWVMLGESWFYAGEGVRRGLVSQHAQHIQKQGSFGRFGLVDGVILY